MTSVLSVVQGLFGQMCGTVDVEDDKASLHHRAVAEYLVSDAVSPRQLAVAVPAVRQVMAEAVMRWLAPVLDDTETAADTGTLSLSLLRFFNFLVIVLLRTLEGRPQPLFGKTCATTQKNVKSHVFLDFEKNVKKRKKTYI